MAAAMMYTVVTPMLNPFIYSLRNKDMEGAERICRRGKQSVPPESADLVLDGGTE